jgi:hypothetical protein
VDRVLGGDAVWLDAGSGYFLYVYVPCCVFVVALCLMSVTEGLYDGVSLSFCGRKRIVTLCSILSHFPRHSLNYFIQCVNCLAF